LSGVSRHDFSRLVVTKTIGEKIMHIHSKACLRLAILAAMLALPVSAQAAAYQVVVHYGDLKLTNPAGAQSLLLRLKAAARQACGGTPGRGELRGLHDYRACLTGSLDQAVATVDAPVVSALYHEMDHSPY
jgi:UrcA family protein